MRVIGLLSFYDEQAEHLYRVVASLAAHGVDHLIAVDGAYGLYPNARGRSGNHKAIWMAAGDMKVEISHSDEPWMGNEVEKRTFMFEHGHRVAEAGKDWLFVVDADEEIVEAGDWREQLETTEFDVGSILHGEQGVRPRRERRLFRAHPRGITVRHAHYFYIDGEERVLWGPGQISREEIDLRMMHRPLERTKERRRARSRYYEERLLSNAEAMAF